MRPVLFLFGLLFYLLIILATSGCMASDSEVFANYKTVYLSPSGEVEIIYSKSSPRCFTNGFCYVVDTDGNGWSIKSEYFTTTGMAKGEDNDTGNSIEDTKRR